MTSPCIVDAHSHLASMKVTPMSFVSSAARNQQTMLEAAGLRVKLSVLVDRHVAQMQDDQADAYVADCRASGVENAFMLCPDFSYVLKDSPLSSEENLRVHVAVAERHSGFLKLFAGVDPRWGADGISLFERAVDEWGYSGLKLYPPCGYSPSDPILDPFYEICSARRLPVIVHIGPTSPILEFKFARPMEVDSAAKRFPDVNFVLAHGATCYVEECMMLASCRPNVYIDVSGYQAGLQAFRRHGMWLLSWGLGHKLLFGTDWPVLSSKMSYKTSIDLFAGERGLCADLSVPEKKLILSENAKRLVASTTCAEPALKHSSRHI